MLEAKSLPVGLFIGFWEIIMSIMTFTKPNLPFLYKNKMSYSVWNGISGMNVNKVGRTSLSLYTFDMMSQKTTYTLSLVDASILPESGSLAA